MVKYKIQYFPTASSQLKKKKKKEGNQDTGCLPCRNQNLLAQFLKDGKYLYSHGDLSVSKAWAPFSTSPTVSQVPGSAAWQSLSFTAKAFAFS